MARRTVPMATTSPRLRELLCRDVLRGAVGALATRAAASTPVQSELLSLVRDILFQELPHSPAPEQARIRNPGSGSSAARPLHRRRRRRLRAALCPRSCCARLGAEQASPCFLSLSFRVNVRACTNPGSLHSQRWLANQGFWRTHGRCDQEHRQGLLV